MTSIYDAWDCGDRHEIRQQLARREEIIRMARESGGAMLNGGEWALMGDFAIERFARSVAAAEREACARVCEPKRPRPCDCDQCDCGNSGDRAAVVDWDASNALAAAIRARGQA